MTLGRHSSVTENAGESSGITISLAQLVIWSLYPSPLGAGLLVVFERTFSSFTLPGACCIVM
jgi:hypothetical protein